MRTASWSPATGSDGMPGSKPTGSVSACSGVATCVSPQVAGRSAEATSVSAASAWAARFGVANLEDAYLALVGRKELSRSHIDVGDEVAS